MRSRMGGFSRYAGYAALLLVIIFFAGVRWHLRAIPLERDEGEYAYAGQLMLHGMAPYLLLYSMKLPGTFAAYALILAIFGQTTIGIHLGLLVVNAATTFLIFLLGKRLFGTMAGAVSAASYALLSTSTAVIGFAAHATHFVVLAAVSGALVLLSAVAKHSKLLYFASGVLFGLAFLMKQPGAAFIAFGLFYVAYENWRQGAGARQLLRRSAVYFGGAALPFAITCLVMLALGGFGRFWFWTFLYAREYETTIGIVDGFHLLRYIAPKIVRPSLGIWLLALVGFTAIAWDRTARRHWFFLCCFSFFSALAVCPGFYFRQHYFVLLLPAIALSAGLVVSSGTEILRGRKYTRLLSPLPTLIFLAAFAASLYVQRSYLFHMDPMSAARATYGANPFPEAAAIAGYIRSHTDTAARIAVLGSEPEIYFYSQRRSATGYVYTYSLMEEQPYAAAMQLDMIREIEAAQPEYIVLVNVPNSFGRLPNSEKLIFRWIDSYLPAHYRLVATTDGSGRFREVDNSSTHRDPATAVVEVFRKSS